MSEASERWPVVLYTYWTVGDEARRCVETLIHEVWYGDEANLDRAAAEAIVLVSLNAALAAQREADCRAVCRWCREGVPFTDGGFDYHHIAFINQPPCAAAAIRQGEK